MIVPNHCSKGPSLPDEIRAQCPKPSRVGAFFVAWHLRRRLAVLHVVIAYGQLHLRVWVIAQVCPWVAQATPEMPWVAKMVNFYNNSAVAFRLFASSSLLD